MRASGIALATAWLVVGAGSSAADLTSAHFTSRGGHVSSAAAGALSAASFSGGASVGQSEAIGPSGATGSLTTGAAGFWPVVAAALPSLDLDGDGIQAFLDPDDDNDGLLDEVETGTGVFASASDTGTDPLVVDSDGDGFGDGDEVAAGSDPNDPASLPPQPVPGLSIAWALALAGLLGGIALRDASRRREPRLPR